MSVIPDLRAYRRIVVAFSGGKDSLAALLYLISLGVPAQAIELHHHDVDGHGPTFMEWPCTAGYVRAIANYFGITVYFLWREGFARELDRTDAPTAPIRFETPEGIGQAGGNGPTGTRGLFPQTAADLRVRWCSPSLKIDVLAAAIRNQARFLDGSTLVVTGERAAESPARAQYAHSNATELRQRSAMSIIGGRSTIGARPGSGTRSRRRASVPIRPMSWDGAASPAGPASSDRPTSGRRYASSSRPSFAVSSFARPLPGRPFTARLTSRSWLNAAGRSPPRPRTQMS